MQRVHKAAAQADRRMVVDAQIHLWKAESEDWKWVPGLKPQLPEPFTIERAISMMDEAGVDRAVVVPPGWPGDRNDYALEAVKRYPTQDQAANSRILIPTLCAKWRHFALRKKIESFRRRSTVKDVADLPIGA